MTEPKQPDSGSESGPKSGKGSEQAPDHLGHRKRLRQRFMTGGPDALADYEMLEMVLFSAIPRGDVKPLAKSLLKRFGSFAEVISASPERLAEVKGIGEAGIVAIKLVREASLRLMQQQIIDRPVLSNWQSLVDYCRASMAFSPIEHFRILFLDRKNVLIADEEQQRGTVSHTPVYPREVVKRALELGASSLIMVHNHPSNDHTPSTADVKITQQVEDAAKSLGIELHDHLIITRDQHTSFKSLGLL